MSRSRRRTGGSVLWVAASGLVVFACCGGGTVGPGPDPSTPTEPPPQSPCELNSGTKFPDDPKLVKNLRFFAPPEAPSADELDGHCRAAWQEVVEDRHCGDVVIPAFCEGCAAAAQKPYCYEGNGRGLVMQRCREEALPTFTSHYPFCKDFELCAGKLQLATLECKAGRP